MLILHFSYLNDAVWCRSLLHVVVSNAGMHYSHLVPKQAAKEMITQKKYQKLKGKLIDCIMKENLLEPMEVQKILDESGISHTGYTSLFKAICQKSQVKLKRGSLLPRPSHLKATRQHVNNEVFEKLGLPFHIEATFFGKGDRKVLYNAHNNLFVDLETLQRYAVHFFDMT